MASAQGLFEVSSVAGAFPDLLALLLSLMLLGSPRTALLLENPAELEPDCEPAGGIGSALAAPVFRGAKTGLVGSVGISFGSLLGLSTQPAGVGGIGPKFDIVCGLLVGGDIIGRCGDVSLVKL